MENTLLIIGLLFPQDLTLASARRCVDDGGCRPGVEICAGGYCQPSRGGGGGECRTDRECAPRKCVIRRCR